MKSVLEQTYPHLEIILIDDGSSDDSYAVAKQYENYRVKVFQQQNQGAASARNTGLKYATGAFVQFLDAGDLISVSKIEVQVKSLSSSVTKLAVCNFMQFTQEKEISLEAFTDQSSFIYSTENTLEFLINLLGGMGSMNFIQTNCWLVPRILIEKAGMWRNYRCPDDDGEFFARIILASDGIIYTPGALNYYHISSGDINHLSKSKNHKYIQNTLLTIDLKHQYLLTKANHPLLNKAIGAQYLRFAVDHFPAQKILSAVAYRRYKKLNVRAKLPILGGPLVELIKYLFGWRFARLLRYYFREAG